MISIVIPVYNRSEIIKRTIDNIFQQTYKDIELIIVDDGSEDNIEEVINSYNDKRLRFIKTNENRGACHARNVGIKAAVGEYIAFQDSDDLWDPSKLQKQLDYLKEKQADICFCGMLQIYEDGTKRKFHSDSFSDKDICLEKELGKSFISTQLLFGKKSSFEEEMFDERFPRFQDWDLGIRLVKKFKMVYLDELLTTRYLQKNSVSNNSQKGYTAGKLLLEKYSDDYKAYPKAEAQFLAFFSKLQEQNGESSRDNLKKSLKQDFKVKTLIKYILQILGLYRRYAAR